MTLSSLKLTFLRGMVPAALLLALALPARIGAQAADQDHLVTTQALQQQVESSSAVRQKNIDTLESIVATPQAQQAMRNAKIDPAQVKNAIPSLSDEELARLSARASHAQQDFAAGHIGPGLFTVIVLAVILIIVIIVVH